MRPTPRIDRLLTRPIPSDPALSPDGSRVVYVLTAQDLDADRAVRRLWTVATAPGSTARPLTGGDDDSAPAWSPDGADLAFLRGRDGTSQIWVSGDGSEPRPLTDLPLGAGGPVWSPDGTAIAFTAPVPTGTGTGPDGRPDPGAPFVTARVDHQLDGQGWVRTVRQLHVVDVATGACRALTRLAEHVGPFTWLGDDTVAYVSRTGDDADIHQRTAVHVVDVTDPGAAPRVVALAGGVASTVDAGPDGDLLVIGWDGDPVGHARLLRVDMATGATADLAGGLDRNVMPGGPAYPGARPRPVGDDVLFCVRDHGCSHLYRVAAGGGTPLPVVAGAGRVVAGASVAAGLLATALTTPTSLGEIALVDLADGTERVLTAHGDGEADGSLHVGEERWFTAPDGTALQGWLLRDPGCDGPLPLLVDIHGGPHNAWNGAADTFHLHQQELVARGWAVLLVNPRASDGYGEAFYNGALGGWGEADAGDITAPIDQLVAEGIADPDRLAVTGYSYGGFLTCYLTGRDHRFAAAVAGGVVSDLVSMVGTCEEGTFLADHELGGRPWENGEGYARMSPLGRVGEVRTPTLVFHGDDDRICPVGQAQQWFTALRERGVPAELVIYPGASHAFLVDGRPSQRRDAHRRLVEWVERHVQRSGRPATDPERWRGRLAALAERHGVPGAQLGVLTADGDLTVVSHGVLSLASGAPVTADSVFQIGSITKVWTATVILQLRDEGRLTLDSPVVDLLPELRLADPDVTRRVTVRHLLTHTSGIDGDVFTDTGRGDDCLERYVELLAPAAQNHPLGATWSYCNAGYVVLGRIIEVLTGTTWDRAMEERLQGPLGLTSTVTLPEDVLLHPAAIGHVDDGGVLRQAPVSGLPRALGPAGLISSNAADLLAFARCHLDGGVAADGTRVVSADAVAEMASHQADLPDVITLGDSWGLGWIRFGWDGQRLIGHDGTTIGQNAFLRLLPEQGLAVALLTNGGNARDLYAELYREVLAELAGLDMPPPFTPPATAPTVDLRPFAGVYERESVRIDVLIDDAGAGTLRTTITGPLADTIPDPVEEHPLVPVGPDLFAVRPAGVDTWAPVTFYQLASGERYLHFGVRATPRTALA